MWKFSSQFVERRRHGGTEEGEGNGNDNVVLGCYLFKFRNIESTRQICVVGGTGGDSAFDPELRLVVACSSSYHTST